MGDKKPAKADGFAVLLSEVKQRIQLAQTRAVLAVNSELVRLYWDIGRIIDLRQKREGWGAAVIPRLAQELKNEMPELKGFSERNIGRMIAFYREYADPSAFLPQAAAKISSPAKVPQPAAKSGTALLWAIPWFHHIVLMEKVKDIPTRYWYMEQALTNGWSRNVLTLQIEAQAHARHGKARSNFALTLPPHQSDLVQQTLKDPYIFDFLTLTEPFHERELETELVRHLEKFLLELGQGFAFVGRQYKLDVGDEEFYIDLLFYHLRLRAFVVIELKKGKFKPEYAGKLNFYCNVVNDRLKQPADQPTIGLMLCQERSRLLAEYSFVGIDKPIGISTYKLTRALPRELRSALPTVEEIEAELAEVVKQKPKGTGGRKKKGGGE
ncbi:MAG TPA: PDDEXK nuclease domain-containing protein [Syntrophales bacterium]|nr:PDDEXK nuclease domain-containing protein [Syntrophales bacterium]HQB13757.1 PDDEXK nuclease domain-containing protein [Syntrophales bacterium]